MDEMDRDARWQQLVVLQAQFDQDDRDGAARGEPIPAVGSLAQHKHRRAARFDEALSGFGGWASVEAPQRRLSA
jgi:hypothetical protein